MTHYTFTLDRDNLTKEDVLSLEWESDMFPDWYNSGSFELYIGQEFPAFTDHGWNKHELTPQEYSYLKLKLS